MTNGKKNTLHLYGDADAGKTKFMHEAAYLMPKIGTYTPDGSFPFNGQYAL